MFIRSLISNCGPYAGALGGLFSQILSGEDVVRERAIKFMATKMKNLPEESFTKEVEDYLVLEAKKVNTDWRSCDCSVLL